MLQLACQKGTGKCLEYQPLASIHISTFCNHHDCTWTRKIWNSRATTTCRRNGENEILHDVFDWSEKQPPVSCLMLSMTPIYVFHVMNTTCRICTVVHLTAHRFLQFSNVFKQQLLCNLPPHHTCWVVIAFDFLYIFVAFVATLDCCFCPCLTGWLLILFFAIARWQLLGFTQAGCFSCSGLLFLFFTLPPFRLPEPADCRVWGTNSS